MYVRVCVCVRSIILCRVSYKEPKSRTDHTRMPAVNIVLRFWIYCSEVLDDWNIWQFDSQGHRTVLKQKTRLFSTVCLASRCTELGLKPDYFDKIIDCFKQSKTKLLSSHRGRLKSPNISQIKDKQQ